MEYCSKCGTQLKEEENFCPQCGKAKNQPVQTSYAEETPQQSPQFNYPLKKILYIALPLAICLLLGLTCPDKEKHVESIRTELTNVLETSNKSENAMYALMGGAVVKELIKQKSLSEEEKQVFNLKDEDIIRSFLKINAVLTLIDNAKAI